MSSNVINQSIKLKLCRGYANTDINGLSEVIIKIPGAFALDVNNQPVIGRTILGGFGRFKNQEWGDYVTADVRDDDNLLGFGAGIVLDRFHDDEIAAGKEGWYFMGSESLSLKPLINNDVTELPAAMYLHICAQKANIATADTFYVNIHWGYRLN